MSQNKLEVLVFKLILSTVVAAFCCVITFAESPHMQAFEKADSLQWTRGARYMNFRILQL
jgi:hypothetical protein